MGSSLIPSPADLLHGSLLPHAMLDRIKQLLIGPPLPTQELGDQRLNKIRALAAFSPDALSSIAYANQEICPAWLPRAWSMELTIAG